MTIEEIDRRIEELESQTKVDLAEMMKLARAGDPKGVIDLEHLISMSVSEIKDLTMSKFQANLISRATGSAA